MRAALASVGQRYTSLSPGQQRNVCTYVVHLLVDSVGLCWLGWLMLNELCLCGEPAMHVQVRQRDAHRVRQARVEITAL